MSLYQHDFSPIIFEMIMSYAFESFSPISASGADTRPVTVVSVTVAVFDLLFLSMQMTMSRNKMSNLILSSNTFMFSVHL